MKFRTKIWMLPLAAASVFLIGLLISLMVGRSAQASLVTLQAVDNPYLEAVLRVDRDAEQLQLTLQSAAAEGDASKLDELKPINADAQKALAAAALLEGKAQASAQLKKVFDDWQTAAVSTTKAMLDKQDFAALLPAMQASQAALDKTLKEQEEAARASLSARFDSVSGGMQRNLMLSGLTGLIVLIVLGVTSQRVIVSVWKDLGGEPTTLRDLVHKVADGDLSVKIPVAAGDSTSLSASVAAMTSRLHDTVRTIRDATDSITTASAEIASGNQDLSSRTEQTASSLQATAGSIEQLTGSVRQSADVANTANDLAGNAASAAERGSQIVSNVVANMSEISTASRKINEIIGVIDGIAFQTNILALNAAVEAARAGEQGRGFAVVAGEVRTLAQRSANAAREIKSLINASTEKVDSGARLVQDAGDAMQQISTGVEKVTRMISDISHATREQSSGIGLINQSVASLD
ncbi:methyl-accepting chemotaxis protein, partial [Ideonella sp.]|uniref:methyl-accepting chemotaxis protein n=1 Tax=Ideonella sp. TaxID=1929293 RepID=UPI003BB585F4